MVSSPPPDVVRDDRIRLRWEPTEQDLVRTLAWATRRSRGLGVSLAIFTAFALLLSGWWLGWPQGVFGVVMGLLSAGISVMIWVLPRFQLRKLRAALPDALAPKQLDADRGGLRLGGGTRQDSYPWSSVQKVRVVRDHLLLSVSRTRWVAIPRRAFGGAEVERRAIQIMRAWRARAQGGTLAPLPPLDPDETQLRYVLRAEDWIDFAQRVKRRDLRFRPGLALMGFVLAGMVVVVGGPLSEGRLDPMSVGFALLYGLIFGLMSLGPLWIPTFWTPLSVRFALWRDPARLPAGDVELRLGPQGGICRSVRGQLQFHWSDVQDLLESEAVVALMFSPSTGVILPRRALAEAPGLWARVRRWKGAGASQDLTVSVPKINRVRGRPPRHPIDPFAPPEG